MDTFTRGDLRRLLDLETWPCVTLCMPMEQGRKGPIQLKNLLARAQKEMIARGVGASDIAPVLKPAQALIENEAFWRNPQRGLAMILSPEGMQLWRVPLELPEAVVVGRRACVKPLLPLATDNGRFYLLAVSQKGARLFAGNRWQMKPVTVDSMPPGLVDALNREPPMSAMQMISGGRGSTPVHTSGGETDTHKDELLVWFRMIDRAMHDYLKQEHAPLVFAGVEYLFPIFNKANTYPHLFPEAVVRGNPDRASTAALHRRATELLAPAWRKAMETDRERFERHLGTQLVSASIEDVLVAAHEGRVETLFVDRDHALWGRFDAQSGTVDLLNEPMPGTEDLLDRAAYETLAHRGRVYSVATGEVPGGISLSALFRYESPKLAPAEMM